MNIGFGQYDVHLRESRCDAIDLPAAHFGGFIEQHAYGSRPKDVWNSLRNSIFMSGFPNELRVWARQGTVRESTIGLREGHTTRNGAAAHLFGLAVKA